MSEWIYGIAAVMLFGTVILQMTPEGTYQKYVRLFLGSVLMLTVLSPVFSLWDLGEKVGLNFEQEAMLSWWGAETFRLQRDEPAGHKTDRWEESMREQMFQKQETWVSRWLEDITREYGFICLAQDVVWNAANNWPSSLTLWLKTAGEGAAEISEQEGTMRIDPVDAVSPVDSVSENSAEGEVYYEPSELRPLHQALQEIWKLPEDRIILYYQRY